MSRFPGRNGARAVMSGVLGLSLGLVPGLGFAQQDHGTAEPAPTPTAPTPTPPPGAPNAAPNAAGDTADPALQQRLDALLGRPGGLTADQVARRAAETSADVRARHQEVEAAQSAVDQLIVQVFPRLSLSAHYARESPITPPSLGNIVVAENAGPITSTAQLQSVPFTFPVILNQYAFSASLTLPLSDYLFRASQAYAAATHSRRAAELNERSSRLRAAFDARVLYYSWVRAILQSAVAEQALAQSREHLVDVQHAFNAGAASQADVMRVRSQLANVELLLARAQNAAALMAGQIETVTHVQGGIGEVGEDIRVEGVGAGDEAAASPAGDFEALYNEALEHRLELMALGETLGSLRDQARVARAGLYPRLDATGSVLTANPNPRYFPPSETFNTTWEVGVSLSWSPNDAALAYVTGHGADARAQQVEEQRNALRDALRTELLQASLALREAQVAVRSTGEGLAASEESYRVRRSLFRNGRATSVELTDAEADLTRARVEALNARVDLRLARARLEHALGRDVSQAP